MMRALLLSMCIALAGCIPPAAADPGAVKLLTLFGGGDGPFSPASVPGLTVWLEADQITGKSDNDSISSWADFTGNGHDADQATGSKQPVYKVGIVNGQPVVRFDGTDDALKTDSVTLSGAHTVFTVWESSSAAMITEQSVNTFTTTGSQLFGHTGGTTGFVRDSPLKKSYKDMGSSMADSTWRVVTTRYDGTHVGTRLWIDGSEELLVNIGFNDDPGTINASDNIYIGARAETSFFVAGDMYAVLYYNAAVSDANRALIETYLKDKVGL